MGSEEDKESSLNRKLSAYLLPFSEGGVQLFRSASFPGESHWPPFVWDCIPIKRELAPKRNKGPAFSALLVASELRRIHFFCALSVSGYFGEGVLDSLRSEEVSRTSDFIVSGFSSAWFSGPES